MTKKIKSWSYSRKGKHDNCPKSAKYVYVEGLDDPSGPAAEEGSRVHLIAEHWVGCTDGYTSRSPMPPELIQFADEFRELRDDPTVQVEDKWGFSHSWRNAQWKKAWCRMVVDVCTTDDDHMRLADYKNGKIRREHDEQLELYALGAFAKFPKINYVTSEIWYLTKGVLIDQEYERGHFAYLKDKWSRKVQPMLSDTKFPARPGRFPCAWCNFNVNAGGPCSDGKPFQME